MEVLRSFEDGSAEVKLPNGRLMRTKLLSCAACGGVRVDVPFDPEEVRASQQKLCVTCFRRYRADRKKRRAEEREMRRSLGESSAERRYAAFCRAMPTWRDKEKIKEVYERARLLTEMTGIVHEVDHIYPIQSEYGCGLHVHENLRVIQKFDNRSKGNSFPFFDSPALLTK